MYILIYLSIAGDATDINYCSNIYQYKVMHWIRFVCLSVCLGVAHSTSCGSMVFIALHGMQTRYSDENSVRPSVRLSVCLSVCHTREFWQNGRKICPWCSYHTKDNL